MECMAATREWIPSSEQRNNPGNLKDERKLKSERAPRGVSQAQLSGTVKGTELTIDGEEWKSLCGGVGGKQCVYFELGDYRRDSVEISRRKDRCRKS